MPLILATGFEPWAEHRCNLSWDCLEACRPSLPADWRLNRLLLPVSWTEAGPLLEAGLAEGPDVAVCFGQCGGDRIRLETTARNRAEVGRADAGGQPPPGERIDSHGPAALPTSLPLDDIAKGLEQKAIPYFQSRDAGGFLCNLVFYRLANWAAKGGNCATVGFVHVPQLGGLPPQQVSRAMEIVIERSIRSARPAFHQMESPVDGVSKTSS